MLMIYDKRCGFWNPKFETSGFWNPPKFAGMIFEQTLTCRASKLVSIYFSHHILPASKLHTERPILQRDAEYNGGE